MPKIRINFPDELGLKNEQVGIGTNDPTARLDVRGNILADNSVGGDDISTITRYDGFLNETQTINHNLSVSQDSKGNLNSLSGEIKISGEVTVTDDTPLTGGRLDSLTVTGKFDLPQGGTEDREDTPEKGSTRFNQDLGQLEFFDGNNWKTVNSYARGGAAGRAVFSINTVGESLGYVNINTLGNAQNFGNLSGDRSTAYGCSSSVRGLWGSGVTPTRTDVIDYITIASEGNAIDFGNLDTGRSEISAISSSTRGVFGGGYIDPGTRTNVIQYVEIGTLGNALDFGDLTSILVSTAGCSNGTRGIFGGGYRTSPGQGSDIDMITISSKGDAISFGDLTASRGRLASCSNSVRGLFAGGRGTSLINFIDYITISSSGNAQYFGDLTTDGTNGRNMLGATANQTRGLFNGGYFPGNTNIIDYVTIMSTGNAQDFGDLTTARRGISGLSDSHGGLGGF